MRQVIYITAVVAVVLVAGCASSGPADTNTDPTTSETTDTPTPPTAPTGTATAPPTATDRPQTGTGPDPDDFELRNDGDSTTQVSLTIRDTETGTVVESFDVALDSGQREVLDVTLPENGRYDIEVSTTDAERTVTRELATEPAGRFLIVVEGEQIRVTYTVP